jgi:succinoglycan biosynthesis protein ExoA
VPIVDEERHIGDCLDSLARQDYPADRVEILVFDGGSRDRSRTMVAARAVSDGRIRLFDNPKRFQSAALNLGIGRARGDAIAYVPGHATLAPDYLTQCVRELTENGVDNVGARRVMIGDTPFTEAATAAAESPFGIGGARHHYAGESTDVATAFPGFFRRSVFERVGGFDETLPVHEDYEMNWRIRQSGGRIRFTPHALLWYRPRSSFRAFARQQFRYGRGKATVARRQPGVMRPYHFVPPLFVAALTIAGLASPASRTARRVTASIAGGYSAFLAAGAVTAGRGRSVGARAWLPAVLATMHLAWGAGLLVGLVSPQRRSDTVLTPPPVSDNALPWPRESLVPERR